MSNDERELEDRIRGLDAPAPDAALRHRVLGAVTRELDAASPPRRAFLARRAPWWTAAALLVGLLAGRAVLEARHTERLQRLAGSASSSRLDGTRAQVLAYARARALLARLKEGGRDGA